MEKISEKEKQELKTYRMTLRNFINDNKEKYLNEGKWNIPFPDIPSWLNLINPNINQYRLNIFNLYHLIISCLRNQKN
jgi:hypothetical protein